MTSATKLTRKSATSKVGGATVGSRSSSPDKTDADGTFKADGTLNDRDQGFDPDPMATGNNELELEDQMEEERLAEMEKKKK